MQLCIQTIKIIAICSELKLNCGPCFDLSHLCMSCLPYVIWYAFVALFQISTKCCFILLRLKKMIKSNWLYRSCLKYAMLCSETSLFFSFRVVSQLGGINNVCTKNNIIQKWKELYFTMVCLKSYGTGSSYCSCSIQLSKFLSSLVSPTIALLRNRRVSWN